MREGDLDRIEVREATTRDRDIVVVATMPLLILVVLCEVFLRPGELDQGNPSSGRDIVKGKGRVGLTILPRAYQDSLHVRHVGIIVLLISSSLI